jgi:hypothetical protein
MPPANTTRRIEQTLRRWDPLRILRGCSRPESEYDVFAPAIAALIAEGASVDALVAHLTTLRIERLGVPADHEEDRRIAALLLDD